MKSQIIFPLLFCTLAITAMSQTADSLTAAHSELLMRADSLMANYQQRIQKMFENSSLVITAWDNDKLVGVCRSITDWVWCCYLSDLAVSPEYKKSGIGRRLIELTKEKVGEQSMILLLSVPTAMEYYPKVGFTKEDRGFIMNRTK